jgi:RNA polymerase sigma-70 factor (ECF subfamily)
VPADAFELVSEGTRRDLVFREALGAIQKHLVRVDANRSWTFLLHDVYGYDLKEVASITGVSVAAAQSRLMRGRREIHERIQADPKMATMIRELCGAEGAT